MKTILLKAVTVIHPESPFNDKKVDLLIEKGTISAIGQNVDAVATEVINGEGKFLAPGFFDLNANFGDPGFETKEDLESGLQAAAAGGFTAVTVMPNTYPAIHSKAEISYIVNKTSTSLVDVYPLGTISYNREGKDLAELYDMLLAGAAAFSDGNRPVADSGLMSRAMLYAKGFNGLVFSFAEDPSIAGNGKMNEGGVSTYLGMKGIPSLAEEVMVARDIFLAEYNEARVHFSTISTRRSVELIREAKSKGLQVTCDVAVHNLLFTDDRVSGFDSNYKVKPPLRVQNDIDALLKGLEDGTIDAIVSQHTPHETEFKNVEFEIASYGIIGLQTVLPSLLQAGLSPQLIVEKLSINPRRVLNQDLPGFAEGDAANFVLFDTDTKWTFDEKMNFSKSSNSPLLDSELTGKVFAVYNKNQFLKF